jgi:hypothetical protein
MKTITTSIRIDAPAHTVWTVLTDAASYPEWNPFVSQLDGALEVGARLTVRISPPGGKGMTFRPRVTAAETGRELAWLGSLGIRGLFDGEHSFLIEPLEDGGCLFTHSERFSGILIPLLSGSLEATEEGFHLMNQAIRDRAEALVASR